MSGSDPMMLAAAFLGLVLMFLVPFLLLRKESSKNEAKAATEAVAPLPRDDPAEARGGKVRRRGGLDAMRRGTAAAAAAAAAGDIDEGAGDEDQDAGVGLYDEQGKKIGAKKREKLARKEELKKRQEEEYERLKTTLKVEEAGSVAQEEAELDSKMDAMVAYIEEQKVVTLEDLAVQFKMRTASAVKRVQQLLQENRLQGLLDDRGKFIHVTDDEMNNVASWIQRRGRVSVKDLVLESNRLIRMSRTSDAATSSS